MKFRVVTKPDPQDHVVVIIPQSLRTLKDVKKIAARGNSNGDNGNSQFAIDTRHLDDKWVYSLAFAFFRHHFAFEKYKTSRRHDDDDSCCCSIVVKDELLAFEIRMRLKCQWFANRLATEPANKMTPELFCQAVKHKFKGTGARINVMDTQELKKRGFGLILSVGQSSVKHPPRFLIIEIGNGPRNICLVGKGVIFDSGGYNLKRDNSMTNMKGDKTGGALAVAAAHYFANRRDLAGEFKIVALVPLVENLIGQNAQLVGDVHTSYCGKTVEVLNTDAEGRLILADALAYASQVYKPDLLLDFATLTGWAGTLHCDTSYVFYTENDKLGSQIFESGERMGERSIRMPNWPEYIEDTKSHIADLKNANYSSCPGGGGFMATMFLSNFIKNSLKKNWIHFDLTHVGNKKSMNTCNGLHTIIDFLDMTFKKMIKAKEI
jgi:leucyl aminopeptidase